MRGVAMRDQIDAAARDVRAAIDRATAGARGEAATGRLGGVVPARLPEDAWLYRLMGEVSWCEHAAENPAQPMSLSLQHLGRGIRCARCGNGERLEIADRGSCDACRSPDGRRTLALGNCGGLVVAGYLCDRCLGGLRDGRG